MAQNNKNKKIHLKVTFWQPTGEIIIVASFQFFSCSSQYSAIHWI